MWLWRLKKRRIWTALAILTLVTAALVTLRIGRQRANHFRQLARFHARRVELFRKSIGSKERAARDCEAYGGETMLRVARDKRAEAKLCVKLAAYHAGLIPKYEHAATRPWSPIAADPPEPAP